MRNLQSRIASNIAFTALIIVSIFVPGQTFAQGSFRISPTEGNVNIVKAEPVEIEYRMINNLSSSLNFELSLSTEDQEFLSQNKVGLDIVVDSTAQNFVEKSVSIEIPANTTQLVTLRVRPAVETPDFEKVFTVKLTQTESTTRLSNSSYELKLKLNSKINSQKLSQQQDLFVIGGAIAVAVVLIFIGLIVNKLGKRKDGKESNF